MYQRSSSDGIGFIDSSVASGMERTLIVAPIVFTAFRI